MKKRCKEVSRSVSPTPFVEKYKVGTRENVANEERTLGYGPREKSASVSISLSLISTQAKASAAGTSRAINLTLRNSETLSDKGSSTLTSCLDIHSGSK